MPRPTLAHKLDPRRFSEMSPKMAAILAFILGDEADWETDPAIVELTVTSDGILFAGDTSDPLANAILGRADELAANLSRLADAAELTEAERGRLGALTAAAITDWRQDI